MKKAKAIPEINKIAQKKLYLYINCRSYACKPGATNDQS